MFTIDGSLGEGGGQVLRSALALSMVTAVPLRIENIRAGRRKPGLMRQHLTAVQAAAAVSQASVEGAQVGSQCLVFAPGAIRPGAYSFSVGTAGSTTLVFQTILPALLSAAGPSTVHLEGGTHNFLAPPFDFLARSFLPLVNRMGPRVHVELHRAGFYPAGGGSFSASIQPTGPLRGFELIERGRVRRRLARALIANLPRHIAERELHTIARRMGWGLHELALEEVEADGPGNIVLIEVESDVITEVFTAFGEIGVPAEIVAGRAVRELRRYLKADVPVGEHLADQILLPLALAGSGSFRTLPLSTHALTQVELLRRITGATVTTEELAPGPCVLVRIG